jgi:flavin reductase (DIM6/NTAB) family NADH-FMN oxidoreductase RutF
VPFPLPRRLPRLTWAPSGLIWHGLPTIPGAAIRLACARYATVPSGDHTIVVGLVTETEVGVDGPLLYHARGCGPPLPLLCGR